MSQTETCECGQRVHWTCGACGVTQIHGDEWYAAWGRTRMEYDGPDEWTLADHDDEVDPVCAECETKIAAFIGSLS